MSYHTLIKLIADTRRFSIRVLFFKASLFVFCADQGPTYFGRAVPEQASIHNVMMQILVNRKPNMCFKIYRVSLERYAAQISGTFSFARIRSTLMAYKIITREMLLGRILTYEQVCQRQITTRKELGPP